MTSHLGTMPSLARLKCECMGGERWLWKCSKEQSTNPLVCCVCSLTNMVDGEPWKYFEQVSGMKRFIF